LQSDYANALQSASKRRKKLVTHKEELLSFAAQSQSGSPTHALNAIAEQGVDLFWQQPIQFINATLHQLMGKRRLVAKENEIVGTVEFVALTTLHK